MKTICNRVFHFENDGNTGSFRLAFETIEEAGRGGDDSDHKSTLFLYFEQMDSVKNDGHGEVTLNFHGPWEFNDFHRGISLLARELTKAFGDPLAKEGAS